MEKTVGSERVTPTLINLAETAERVTPMVNAVVDGLGGQRVALFDYAAADMSAAELGDVRRKLRVLYNALGHLDMVLGIGAGNG